MVEVLKTCLISFSLQNNTSKISFYNHNFNVIFGKLNANFHPRYQLSQKIDIHGILHNKDNNLRAGIYQPTCCAIFIFKFFNNSSRVRLLR